MNLSTFMKVINIKSGFLYLFYSLIFLYKIFQFIQDNPQFYLYWDWPGHFDKAIKLGLPWQGGWDTSFWGGYPTLLYPSLSHYVLKGLLLIFPDQKTAAIAMSLLAASFLLFSFYFLVKKYIDRLSIDKLVVFGLMILLTFYSSPSYLASFNGLLLGGGFTATIATALFILIISNRNAYLRGIFYGVLLLTHTLTALMAGIFLLIGLTLNYLSHKQEKANNTGSVNFIRYRSYLTSLLVGLAIGAPWLVSFIDPAFKSTAFNVSGQTPQVTFILLFGLLVLWLEYRPKITTLWVFIFLLGLMTLAPEGVVDWLQEFFPIKGLHFYRFSWFFIILIPLIIRKTVPSRITLRKDWSRLSLLLLMALLMIKAPVLFNESELRIIDTELDLRESRMMDVSPRNLAEPYIHAIEFESAKNLNANSAAGLFFESSQRGLQYYELANIITPSKFKNGTYGILFNDLDGNPRQAFDVDQTSRLLGINYISRVTLDKPETNSDIHLIGEIRNRYDPESVRFITLEKLNDEPLISTLAKIPKYSKRISLGSWWLDTDHLELLTDQGSPLIDELNLTEPDIDNISISEQTITFKVNSDMPAPVLIKFTYNKYWKAWAQDNQSFTTQPQWVTPGHMMIFANGNIKLYWHTPIYLSLSWLASGLVMLLAVIKFAKK